MSKRKGIPSSWDVDTDQPQAYHLPLTAATSSSCALYLTEETILLISVIFKLAYLCILLC